jgi:hypothetical protein
MSNINIENLSFDDKVDREAMNAITGGWSFYSIWGDCTGRTGRNPLIKQASRAYNVIRSWF